MRHLIALVFSTFLLGGCYLVSDEPLFAEGDEIVGLPDLFHLALERPADTAYGSADMINGFEGTFEARSDGRYFLRGNRDGTRGQHILFKYAFEGDRKWGIAQLSPPFASRSTSSCFGTGIS